jgi:hypothetical protein
MPHVNELHEQHDQILVVSFASGDLAPDDRDRTTAQGLIDACTECAALHNDIVAIARATRALPPAVRTHDFRLTPEQASKLRPTGWRRFIAGLSAPGSLLSRQLGLGLATLGIAGLLLNSAPSIQLGMGGSAAAPAAAPSAPAAAASGPVYDRGAALSGPGASASQPGYEGYSGPRASAAASAAAASTEPVPAAGGQGAPASDGFDTMASASTQITTAGGPKASALPTIRMPEPAPTGERNALLPENPAAAPPASGESGSGPSGLVIVSTVLLGAGVLVLLLRSISRRIAAG